MKVLVINGVNLNKLGARSKEYGTTTLAELEKALRRKAEEIGAETEFFTSNYEGYAIADALKDKTCKKIEVHMTNVQAREEFRRTSVISPYVDGVIAGFGANSYLLALAALA